jgi:hypothetical protein
MSLYLYAIALNENLSDLEILGINQQPVEFKAINPFIVVFSQAMQERYLASRAHLLAHERVIEAVMNVDHHNVPLPLQFGLVVDDWAEVEEKLIAGHQKDLQALLGKLKGKREVGIKIFWEQMTELNLILAENHSLNQEREALIGKKLSMDEAITIGKEIETAIERRKQNIIDGFMETLEPLCHEYAIGELLTENMIYNAAFLIDWEQEEEFAITVENLDAKYDHRLRIRYNNFTAPYNFVNLNPD